MIRLVVYLLQLYVLVLLAYSVMSWVMAYARLSYDSTLAKVNRVLAKLVDPVVAPVRKLIKPVRIGTAYLDLSVLIVFLVLQIIIIPVVASI